MVENGIKEILKELKIELKDHVKKIIEPLKGDENNYSLEFLKILFSNDLSLIINKGSIPLDIHKLNVEPLKGVHLLQLLEAEDITISREKDRFYFNSKIKNIRDVKINAPGSKRILKLIFTDGKTIFIAMEFCKMPELDEFVNYWCNFKDNLMNKDYNDLNSIQVLALLSGEPIIRRGVVLLLPGMLTFIKLETNNTNENNHVDYSENNVDFKKKTFIDTKITKSKKKNTKGIVNDNIDIRSYTNFNFIQSGQHLINKVKNKSPNSYYETELTTHNLDFDKALEYSKHNLKIDVTDTTRNNSDSHSQSSSVILMEGCENDTINLNEKNLISEDMSKLGFEIEEMRLNELEDKFNDNYERTPNSELFEDFQSIYNEYDYIDEFETFEERILRDQVEYNIYLKDENKSSIENNIENEPTFYYKEDSDEKEEIIWVEGAVLNSKLSSENEIILELGIHYPKFFSSPWNELINEQVFLNLELAKKILYLNEDSEINNEQDNENEHITGLLLAYVRFVQGTICLKLVNYEIMINDIKTKKSKVYFAGLIPFLNDSDYIVKYLNSLEEKINEF
ncbi:hypothetical protein FG386_001098 [Cryptosporidium ryanae]|uniref:uncharacterized protein n=1 Tax=Cryptosporidium ryanae TaxID=515981 RepID=UPI003519E34F|nr:hypothetical protein FG386_001098 [Cryptosporidium ryanae]